MPRLRRIQIAVNNRYDQSKLFICGRVYAACSSNKKAPERLFFCDRKPNPKWHCAPTVSSNSFPPVYTPHPMRTFSLLPSLHSISPPALLFHITHMGELAQGSPPSYTPPSPLLRLHDHTPHLFFFTNHKNKSIVFEMMWRHFPGKSLRTIYMKKKKKI